MTDSERMARLGELIADKHVQVFPEKTADGIMKLLEMRNLITALAPRLSLSSAVLSHPLAAGTSSEVSDDR